MAKDPALTSSYKAPKNAKKIPKGDTGFKIVDKAFKAENEAETSSYIPPQSPYYCVHIGPVNDPLVRD